MARAKGENLHRIKSTEKKSNTKCVGRLGKTLLVVGALRGGGGGENLPYPPRKKKNNL